jgi:hypothetical protein
MSRHTVTRPSRLGQTASASVYVYLGYVMPNCSLEQFLHFTATLAPHPTLFKSVGSRARVPCLGTAASLTHLPLQQWYSYHLQSWDMGYPPVDRVSSLALR